MNGFERLPSIHEWIPPQNTTNIPPATPCSMPNTAANSLSPVIRDIRPEIIQESDSNHARQLPNYKAYIPVTTKKCDTGFILVLDNNGREGRVVSKAFAFTRIAATDPIRCPRKSNSCSSLSARDIDRQTSASDTAQSSISRVNDLHFSSGSKASSLFLMRADHLNRIQKRRENFPKHVTNTLNYWLERNADHPYPDEQDKLRLSKLTGLSIAQINNWFVNARRRTLPNIIIQDHRCKSDES